LDSCGKDININLGLNKNDGFKSSLNWEHVCGIKSSITCGFNKKGLTPDFKAIWELFDDPRFNIKLNFDIYKDIKENVYNYNSSINYNLNIYDIPGQKIDFTCDRAIKDTIWGIKVNLHNDINNYIEGSNSYNISFKVGGNTAKGLTKWPELLNLEATLNLKNITLSISIWPLHISFSIN
jgi:hypothetical protein